MADLQMSLNKWVAGIISAMVVILQVLNGLQELTAVKLEKAIELNETVDQQKLNQILAKLQTVNPSSNPSPAPSATPP